MFDNVIEEIKKTIELAEERRNLKSEVTEFKVKKLDEFYSSPDFKARKKIVDYLETLSYEQIQMIQTIMYIGRDTYDDEVKISPLELYNKTFESLTWNEKKGIEISQMVEKAPLADYLRRGVKLLKINL